MSSFDDSARQRPRGGDGATVARWWRGTAERFETLRRALGGAFIAVEIDSSEGNAHGFKKAAHSVLTAELSDEPGHPTNDALQLVLEHFRTRLLGA